MELEVTPPVDDAVVRALADVLDEERATGPDTAAWQRAALAESVEGEESYAFSPRSTRGATRA